MDELFFSYYGKDIIVTDYRPSVGYFCRDFDCFERIFLSMQCPANGIFWSANGLTDRQIFKLFKRKGLHKCVRNYRHMQAVELPAGLQA